MLILPLLGWLAMAAAVCIPFLWQPRLSYQIAKMNYDDDEHDDDGDDCLADTQEVSGIYLGKAAARHAHCLNLGAAAGSRQKIRIGTLHIHPIIGWKCSAVWLACQLCYGCHLQSSRIASLVNISVSNLIVSLHQLVSKFLPPNRSRPLASLPTMTKPTNRP